MRARLLLTVTALCSVCYLLSSMLCISVAPSSSSSTEGLSGASGRCSQTCVQWSRGYTEKFWGRCSRFSVTVIMVGGDTQRYTDRTQRDSTSRAQRSEHRDRAGSHREQTTDHGASESRAEISKPQSNYSQSMAPQSRDQHTSQILYYWASDS